MISSSIVTYHTPVHELIRLLDCIIKSDIETCYLIDNSSNDSLRELSCMSSKIKYIYSNNLGFGHGHNIAIKKAIEGKARYHIVINPDIYWSDNAVIERLADFMDTHLDCGLVMPKVLYPNGNIQYLCKLLPTPIDLFGRRFLAKRIQNRINIRYELHAAGYDKIMEVPSLSGCFMFIRTEVLAKIGMFDERFFMYAEDIDLCRRIGEVSKTIFNPTVSIYHVYGKGSHKDKKLLKYHICSTIKYFNKWGWFFDEKRKRINKKCLNTLGY